MRGESYGAIQPSHQALDAFILQDDAVSVKHAPVHPLRLVLRLELALELQPARLRPVRQWRQCLPNLGGFKAMGDCDGSTRRNAAGDECPWNRQRIRHGPCEG